MVVVWAIQPSAPPQRSKGPGGAKEVLLQAALSGSSAPPKNGKVSYCSSMQAADPVTWHGDRQGLAGYTLKDDSLGCPSYRGLLGLRLDTPQCGDLAQCAARKSMLPGSTACAMACRDFRRDLLGYSTCSARLLMVSTTCLPCRSSQCEKAAQMVRPRRAPPCACCTGQAAKAQWSKLMADLQDDDALCRAHSPSLNVRTEHPAPAHWRLTNSCCRLSSALR